MVLMLPSFFFALMSIQSPPISFTGSVLADAGEIL
jgi:hypothetical protein